MTLLIFEYLTNQHLSWILIFRLNLLCLDMAKNVFERTLTTKSPGMIIGWSAVYGRRVPRKSLPVKIVICHVLPVAKAGFKITASRSLDTWKVTHFSQSHAWMTSREIKYKRKNKTSLKLDLHQQTFFSKFYRSSCTRESKCCVGNSFVYTPITTLVSGNVLNQGEGVVPPSRRRRRLGRQWRRLETNEFELQIRN